MADNEKTAEAEKPSRKVAEHAWLDAKNNKVDSITEATGIRYTDVASGESVDWQVPGAAVGTILSMFALFGAKTRFINTASQARQARKRGDSQATDVQGIQAMLEHVADNQWKEPSASGPRGPKWDLKVLGEIMAKIIGKGKAEDYTAKLEADVPWRRKAMANEKFRSAYLKAVKADTGNVEDFSL